MRISNVLRAVALMIVVLGVAGAAAAQSPVISPDNPTKSLAAAPGLGIPIVSSGDLINTSFACNGGLGPFTTALNSYNNPDEFEYFRGFCTPGDPIDIAVYRLNADADPGAHACEGDLTGGDTTQWAPFACPAGVTLLDSADDNLPAPCAGGSYADPQLSFTCPAGGVFTLAAYDVLGDGPTPTFEVHGSGLAPAAPAVPAPGLLVLAALVLASGVFVLARRRYIAV